MKRLAGFMTTFIACVCCGQTPQPSRYVQVNLPPEVAPESMFIRYVLARQSFGGWVEPRSGVSSFVINTGRAGGIKAVLYAPGCAIRTLELSLSGSTNPEYSFVCQPVRNIPIAGTVVRTRLYGRPVKIQARYLAHWANRFLGLDDDTVMSIPIGDSAELSDEGRFLLTVPDLSQDPLAGDADHSGEVRIYARDKSSETMVAQLVPKGMPRMITRLGGLKVQSGYPVETAFTTVFSPCTANPPRLHTREGFAIRPDINDVCGE